MIVKKKVTEQSKERPSVSVTFVSPTESEQERLSMFYEGSDGGSVLNIKPLPIFRKPHKAAPTQSA